jgi:hypothetical protein
MTALDLAQRAVACKGWRWMPGMLATARDGKAWRLWSARGRGRADLPDLDDPATLGCLLALVREAWSLPGWALDVVMLTIIVEGQRVQVMTIVAALHGAKVWSTTESGTSCNGDALVAALEAAP